MAQACVGSRVVCASVKSASRRGCSKEGGDEEAGTARCTGER